MTEQTILVTGATGYVGNRLIPRLLRENYRVRAVSRNRGRMIDRSWAGNDAVELVEADALDLSSLKEATGGCDIVYYLIHSMGQGDDDFAEADKRAAENMTKAAARTGVRRIIYLGGLGHHHDNLSKHRESRREVANCLQSGEVPVTILRAAMIVGSGSASFELTRYCVEYLPVMLTHRWIDNPTQPIAISNVLQYLVGCLESPGTTGEAFDIGGPEVLTGRDVMQTYARVAGLPERWILSTRFVPLEFTARRTASLLPLPEGLVHPLVMGARNPAVCRDTRIRDLIPQKLISLESAMERALELADPYEYEVYDRSEDEAPAEWIRTGDPEWAGGTLYRDERSVEVQATPDAVWNELIRIGSENGIFFANWLRSVVAAVDHFTGIFEFPDRPQIQELREGEILDFWRVIHVEKYQRVVLEAAFNLPGQARLEYNFEEHDGGVTCRQIARFRPRGLMGRLYWAVISLFHYFSFPSMLKAIGSASGTINKGPVKVGRRSG